MYVTDPTVNKSSVYVSYKKKKNHLVFFYEYAIVSGSSGEKGRLFSICMLDCLNPTSASAHSSASEVHISKFNRQPMHRTNQVPALQFSFFVNLLHLDLRHNTDLSPLSFHCKNGHLLFKMREGEECFCIMNSQLSKGFRQSLARSAWVPC